MTAPEARGAVEAAWRMESARIVGALARYTGDFPLAEDLAQEALAEALVSWSVNGVPAEPVGWLLTTGRRRAIDTFRRLAARDEKYALLARDLAQEIPGADALFSPDAIDDDVLALMFIACHPMLSREARIALTLRVVGGMGSGEIAKAFLVPVPTIQARITRAKKTLAAAHVPFAVPEAHELAQRLGSVLQVVYLIFTEGSSHPVATSGFARIWPARRAGWLACWCGSRPSPRCSGCSHCWNSPPPDFQHDSMRPNARCFLRTRTDSCGTGRRSGADVRHSHGPWGLDVGWARTAFRRPLLSVTRWRTRWPRPTGSGSSFSMKPSDG